MAKIEQMDQFVMNIGIKNVGCTPCSIYSVIAFGGQSFHLFCNDEERFEAETLAEVTEWYWEQNSVHSSKWESLREIFKDKNLYLKDQRNFYFYDGNDEIIIHDKMFAVAYYFAESENPTFEGLIESVN
jgi:hypothetical protein